MQANAVTDEQQQRTERLVEVLGQFFEHFADMEAEGARCFALECLNEAIERGKKTT